MKSKLPTEKLFLWGLLVSSLICIPHILDLTLMPRFIALSLLVLMIVLNFYKSGGNFGFKIDLILLSYLSYAIYVVTSVAWAINTAEALFDSAKVCLGFLVFSFVYYNIKHQPSTFLLNIYKVAALVCLVEITCVSVQVAFVPNFQKESMYLITGLNGHKNLVSSFLFIQLIFLIAGCAKLNGNWKLFSLLCLVISIAIILLLRTRAVWLAIFAGMIVFGVLYFFYRKRKAGLIKINSFIVIVALVLLGNLFFIKLLPLAIESGLKYSSQIKDNQASGIRSLFVDQERLTVWDKTYQIFNKKFLTGHGSGNWQINFPDAGLTGLWRVEDLNVTFQRPHNDFLWILAEQGLIGFNLYLVFICSLIVLAIKSIKNCSDNTQEALLLILFISGLFGYLIISFFDFPKERIEHLIWLNVIFAILYAYNKKNAGLWNVEINFGKPIFTFLTICTFFILVIGLLRLKGEYYTKQLYDYKRNNNVQEIVKAGKAAWSFAYTIDPTSIPLDWYIGNANASMANYMDAQKSFLKAYSYNPFNRNVLNDLASSYVFNQQTERAILLYEEAARISPRFDDAKLNLVALYIANSDFKKAQFWLSSLLHDSERRTRYQKTVDFMLGVKTNTAIN